MAQKTLNSDPRYGWHDLAQHVIAYLRKSTNRNVGPNIFESPDVPELLLQFGHLLRKNPDFRDYCGKIASAIRPTVFADTSFEKFADPHFGEELVSDASKIDSIPTGSIATAFLSAEMVARAYEQSANKPREDWSKGAIRLVFEFLDSVGKRTVQLLGGQVPPSLLQPALGANQSPSPEPGSAFDRLACRVDTIGVHADHVRSVLVDTAKQFILINLDTAESQSASDVTHHSDGTCTVTFADWQNLCGSANRTGVNDIPFVFDNAPTLYGRLKKRIQQQPGEVTEADIRNFAVAAGHAYPVMYFKADQRDVILADIQLLRQAADASPDVAYEISDAIRRLEAIIS